ncbi:hypothetical protein BDW68DRAFT_172548 [Aspergillus falconensis]
MCCMKDYLSFKVSSFNMSVISHLQKALAVLQIRSFSFLSIRVCKDPRSPLRHLWIPAQSTDSTGANPNNANPNGSIKHQDKDSNTAKSTQATKRVLEYYSLKDYREGSKKQHDEVSNTAESTQPTKQATEYYSLKDYREGPNTESGKLDSRCDSPETKRHNLDVENRHKKE